eukprot:Colp12_sorted_trinity150504_noHs@32600
MAPNDQTTLDSFKAVPVVDLEDWQTGRKEDVVSALKRACTEIGFFYVKNHGVHAESVPNVLKHASKFFGLPLEEKLKVARRRYNPNSTHIYHGYFPVEENQTSHKEGFDVGSESPFKGETRNTMFHETNLWPDANLVPGFKETLVSYFEEVSKLGATLMSLIAQALDLPPNYFEPFFQDSITTLRLLRYPSPAEGAAASGLNCSEHTDSGVLTLLYQDPTGGLQVQNSSGAWVDVPFIPGTFVVNIGDMLQRWSNDRCVATVHRVLRSPRERYSIPLFYEPSYDAPIACLPTCASPLCPPRYPQVKYGDFLLNKIRQFVEFQ